MIKPRFLHHFFWLLLLGIKSKEIYFLREIPVRGHAYIVVTSAATESCELTLMIHSANVHEI